MKLFISGLIAIGVCAWMMSKFPNKDVGFLFYICLVILSMLLFLIFKYFKNNKNKVTTIDYTGIRAFIAFVIDINIFGVLFGLPSIFLYDISNRLFVYLGAICSCSYFMFANVFFTSLGFYLVELDQFNSNKKLVLLSNYLYVATIIGIVVLLINNFVLPMAILSGLLGLDWLVFLVFGRNTLFTLCDVKYKKIVKKGN